MSSVHFQTLKSHYPWISTPLITSAPMRLISEPPLALAVSRSGGLGFIGCGTSTDSLAPYLRTTIASLKEDPIPSTPSGVLPIGIGFICFGCSLPEILSTLSAPLKPAAVWFFAPKEQEDLVSWSKGIRDITEGKTKIWVQVGTVEMALSVARSCAPDVLVIQGSDAGGHGLAHSSSIISLLPECVDTLAKAGFGHIPLIAAGGISDGRGVAAALALGASGICMGTRFLASQEATLSKGYQKAVLDTVDGGVTTARTTVYDRLRGTTGWPEQYNGRGVLNESFRDWERGVEEDVNKGLYEEAVKKGDEGWGIKGRMTTYAGTGVGLVKEVKGAREIVEDVRKEAREVISNLQF